MSRFKSYLSAFGPSSQVTNPEAMGYGALLTWRAKYVFADDGGAQGLITPKQNVLIPDNAIILGTYLNPTIAPVGASATLAFGTSAGSSASALKAATAITSFTLDALVAGVPVMTAASAVKMTAAGYLTMTIATTDLTAGAVEITCVGFVAAA